MTVAVIRRSIIAASTLLAASAAPTSAGCVQADLLGKWSVFGSVAASTSATCTLYFNAAGSIDSVNSKCTYYDPRLKVRVTVKVLGSLLVKFPAACIFSGDVFVNGGSQDGRKATLTVGLSRDKTIMAGTGFAPAASLGTQTAALNFTAIKR